MVATIDQGKLPTDWQGRPQMPIFVVVVNSDGEDASASSPSRRSAVTGTFTAAVPNAAAAYASGTTADVGLSAAFPASVGRAVRVMLRGNAGAGTPPGTFNATVILLRSTDGGQTWNPETVGGGVWASFTAPCQEAIDSEDDTGTLYRLACTAYTSGTITYRLGHS